MPEHVSFDFPGRVLPGARPDREVTMTTPPPVDHSSLTLRPTVIKSPIVSGAFGESETLAEVLDFGAVRLAASSPDCVHRVVEELCKAVDEHLCRLDVGAEFCETHLDGFREPLGAI